MKVMVSEVKTYHLKYPNKIKPYLMDIIIDFKNLIHGKFN